MERKKYCSGCDKYRPLKEFHRNSCKVDGLQVWCIGCTAENVKKREAKNRAKWANNDPYAGGE